MRIGAVFPQTEIGSDPIVIRDYAQAVEGMGFTHLLAYDHVLGASTATRPNWRGAYTSDTPFHEPFVLFGYLAGLTQRLELVTGVLVLPQRQTVLVAKQAAEVDLLSGGRLRLGVGVGWNDVEYTGLGENFSDRGARSEEQVAVLRALWADPVVDFQGRWHTIEAAGINPRPARRSIPIWIGGYAETTIQRVARFGDGWFPWRDPDDKMRATLERLREYTIAAGRDPAAIGLEPQLTVSTTHEAEWQRYFNDWRELGATHFCVNTMGMRFSSAEQHLAMLQRVKDVVGE